jgi:hypothetical protein
VGFGVGVGLGVGVAMAGIVGTLAWVAVASEAQPANRKQATNVIQENTCFKLLLLVSKILVQKFTHADKRVDEGRITMLVFTSLFYCST